MLSIGPKLPRGNLGIALALYILVLFTHRNVMALEIRGECESVLVSKRTLESWEVTSEGVAYWLSNKDTAPAIQAAVILNHQLKNAPTDAIDIITLLSFTRLGDASSEKTLIRHFRQMPFIDDLEVILGQDIKAFATPITNLYFAERFVTGEAKKWLHQVLRSPIATLLIAQTMSQMPKPTFGGAFSFFSATHHENQARDVFYRIRNYGLGDANLEDLVRGNPLVAANFAKVVFGMSLPSAEWKKHLNPPGAPRAIKNPKTEAMIEWIAENLTSPSSPTGDVPESWIKVLRLVVADMSKPLSKKRKVVYQGQIVLTPGEAMLVDMALEVVKVMDIESGEDFLEEIVDPNKFSSKVREILVTAPSNEIYRESDSVFIAKLILAVGNVKIPGQQETRSLLQARIKNVVAEIAQLAPFSGEADASEQVIKMEEEPTVSAHLELETQAELWVPYHLQQMALSEGMETAPIEVDGHERIEDVLEGKKPIEDIAANTIYEVVFARPNSKFGGVQRVAFSKKSLERMRSYQGKDLEVLSWLHAIKMGMARSHGQRGLKILNSGGSLNTYFEVKLLMTSFRLFGHWQNGVWYIDSLVNAHQ